MSRESEAGWTVAMVAFVLIAAALVISGLMCDGGAVGIMTDAGCVCP